MYFIHRCIFCGKRAGCHGSNRTKRTPNEDSAMLTLSIVLGSLLALLAAGWLFEALGEHADARRFPPLGRLVDVGAHRLHLVHKGPSGGPTVVIEQGAGEPWIFWWAIVERVAKFASVCSLRPRRHRLERCSALGVLAARQRARAPHAARARANPRPVHRRRALLRRADREAVHTGPSERRRRPRARRLVRRRHPLSARRAADVSALPLGCSQ